MSTECEEFFTALGSKDGKADVSKALRAYYARETSTGRDTSGLIEALPILMYKTHVSTIVDGLNKEVSMSDFKNILTTLTGEEEEKIPPIALPYGCFMFNRSGENLYLNCYYRETIGEIKFHQRDEKEKKFKIPLPNMILSFNLKKAAGGLWQVMIVRYFATSKTVTQLPDDIFITQLSGDKGIHKLPFPNMYTDNKMCYGGNTMPVRFTNNLRGLDYYYQILTQAPFNSDLGVNGLTSSYTPKSWFEFLASKTEFPYQLLSKIN
jgi:hypothetical protein